MSKDQFIRDEELAFSLRQLREKGLVVAEGNNRIKIYRSAA